MSGTLIYSGIVPRKQAQELGHKLLRHIDQIFEDGNELVETKIFFQPKEDSRNDIIGYSMKAKER